jgi:hypothetical protein
MVKRTLFSLLAAMLGLIAASAMQEPPRYHYAYLVAQSRAEAQIAIVDPAHLDAPSEYRDLGFPPDWRPPAVTDVSPDREWIVFVAASKSGAENDLRYMRLQNLVTGETRDFEPGHIYVGDYGIDHAVYWSPDSRFFAFNGFYGGSDILIYALAERTTTNITNDEQAYAAFAWSLDSTKLAALIQDCPTAESCIFQLQVLDLRDGSRQTSPNLVEVAPMVGGLGCNLAWSPDGRYVSFYKGCFAFSASVAQEVFAWDTLRSELKQVTNFTLPAFQLGGAHFAHAAYTPIWYDADTLMIGASYLVQPNRMRTEATYRYDVIADTLTPLYEGETEAWSFNPVTDQVAARVIMSPDQADGTRISGEIHIFELNPDETSRTIQRILPLGCDLSWSPDGAILAYTVRENCAAFVERFAFVDGALGTAAEYVPLLENGEMPYGVANIGWIAVD